MINLFRSNIHVKKIIRYTTDMKDSWTWRSVTRKSSRTFVSPYETRIKITWNRQRAFLLHRVTRSDHQVVSFTVASQSDGSLATVSIDFLQMMYPWLPTDNLFFHTTFYVNESFSIRQRFVLHLCKFRCPTRFVDFQSVDATSSCLHVVHDESVVGSQWRTQKLVQK